MDKDQKKTDFDKALIEAIFRYKRGFTWQLSCLDAALYFEVDRAALEAAFKASGALQEKRKIYRKKSKCRWNL